MARDPLILAADHAKWVLVAGLVAGAGFPGLASAMAGYLLPLVMLIMFLGTLRVPPADTARVWAAPLMSLRDILTLQLVLPLGALALFHLAGVADRNWAIAVALVLSAAPIISSPNIAAILGIDQVTALRLVLWGTALVPVSSLPILWLLPVTQDPTAVVFAALRLVAIIALSAGLALLLRRVFLARVTPQNARRLDGASAISLGVFVIALMPAFLSTLLDNPLALAGWVALAFCLNFGIQLSGYRLARVRLARPIAASRALVAGNRNVALFFAALPAESAEPLLPFLAAYQLPMFLTPLLLARLYRN